MQFIDLATQQQRIRKQVDARIQTVLDHGVYIMGPEVEELEACLCAFTGAKHCITCSSGTDALLMPLMAWDIKPQDAVFVPACTFFATAEQVALLGAIPIFVDINPSTFNMNPEHLEKAILAVQNQDDTLYPLPKIAKETKLRPRAIIPVDLFGQLAEYEAILSIAEKHQLYVLEDAAQSFGASQHTNGASQNMNDAKQSTNGASQNIHPSGQHTKKSCALSCHAAATSFFPAKPLGCYGDGGAIFTDDDALAKILRSIRVHGKGVDKYDNVRIGVNGRLDTLQAAILLAKMDIFPEELQARQQVAQWYAKQLCGVAEIVLPHISKENISAWAQYCILLPQGKRDGIMQKLKEKNIPTNIYYPKPLHMLEVFKHLSYAPEDMPQALHTSKNILALPFHPYMEASQVRQIANAIKEAL